eukprot:scaffold6554_cov307-Chaetoceros_neogracile.AAC.2
MILSCGENCELQIPDASSFQLPGTSPRGLKKRPIATGDSRTRAPPSTTTTLVRETARQQAT